MPVRPRTHRLPLWTLTLCLFAALTGCSGGESGSEGSTGASGDTSSCRNGTDGCACYGNGTCNAGLVCTEDVCLPEACDDGKLGCPCYGNGTCNGELVCASGQCVATSTSSEDEPMESCAFDEDCPRGFACHAGLCSAYCESVSDCALGEACAARAGGAEGRVCVLSEETVCTRDANCAAGEVCVAGTCVAGSQGDCMTNEECGTGNVCLEGACVEAPQGPAYQVVQILDESEGTSCSNFSQSTMKGDPGADVMYAYLVDRTGNIKGWAELVDFTEGTSGDKGNGYNDLSALFDGNAPDYIGSAECPASFREGKHVSLGCGGYLLVRFLDAGGTTVTLAAGDQVNVAEWGAPSCGSVDTSDVYSVNLCTNTAEALTMNTASCDVALGLFNGGINSCEVVLP